MTTVVFPSFSGESYSQYDMRQLVSALELRFQSLEQSSQDALFDTDTGSLDGLYSPIGHVHSESEVIDLQSYLLDISSESIFSLTDVTGSPSNNDVLVYNSSTNAFESVAPGAAAAVALGDLSDVSTVGQSDGQVLTYVAGNSRWEPAGSGAGITSFAALTDTDLTAQAQYDLVFNANGSDWHDTAGKLQWNPTFEYLQLANAHSINWRNKAFSSIEMLQFEEVGAAGTPANIVVFESTAEPSSTTTSTTYVDTTDGLDQAQSEFGDGDEVLIVYQAIMYNNNSSGGNSNGFQIIGTGGTALDGAEQLQEGFGSSGTLAYGNPYGYVGYFTADTAGANIKTQFKKSAFGTDYIVVGESGYMINLTQSVPNHIKDKSQTTIQGDGATWVSTDVSVTVPAGDYIVYVCSRWSGGFNGATSPMNGYNDGTNDVSLCGRVIEDSGTDALVMAGAHYLDAYSGGTLTVIGMTGNSLQGDMNYNCIVVIPLSDFNSSWAVQQNDTERNLANYNTDEVINTLSITSIPNTANYLALAWASFEWGGASPSTCHDIRENVNAAGETVIGWSNLNQMVKYTTVLPWEGQNINSSVRTYSSGDQVDITQVALNPNAGGYPVQGHRSEGLLLLELNSTTTQEERFTVGDPVYPLELDGTLASLDNNIGVNWRDNAGDRYEFLNLENTAAVAGDALWASTQLLAEFDGADAAVAYTEVSDNLAVATFVANAQLDTAQFNFGTSSLLLDGTGDYVSFPDIAGYDLAPSGAQDWTIEVFVRFNALLANPETREVAGQDGAWQMEFSADGFSTQRVHVLVDGNNETTTIGNTTVATGTWYHYVMQRQGNDLYVGFNGFQEFIGTGLFAGAQATSANPITIGSTDAVTAADMWDGWVDDMRITIGTARYDLSVSTYTVPTSYTVGGDVAGDDDFVVGDPAFDTRIDGLTTNITSASIDIDGTLNVDGNATFVLDVDIDGVLESDHVIAGDPGTEGTGIQINGALYESVLKASDIGGTHAAQFIMHRHSTTLPAAIVGARSNTDDTTHAILADTDIIMGIYAAGWDGVDSYSLSSAIDFQIDGTPGANDMPGQIEFFTAADGTEALTPRMRIRATGDVEMDYDLTVAGDFTVNGTLTSINTADLNIADNLIVLNSDEVGTPSQDAGIEVERGTSTNVQIIWDETLDRWTISNDGATWYPITTEHTGEVTGGDTLTLDVTAITNRADVVADAADDVAIHDDSDGTIKKVNLSSITDGGYF